jgi:hypothetical protein
MIILFLQVWATVPLLQLPQVLSKSQKHQFTFVFVNDGTAFEKHFTFTLAPSFRKLTACFNLKSKSWSSVFGPQTYFLYNNFGRFGLHFLLFLFLVVKELSVINHFANRWDWQLEKSQQDQDPGFLQFQLLRAD